VLICRVLASATARTVARMSICGGLSAETCPDLLRRQIGHFLADAIVVPENDGPTWLVVHFSEGGQGLCIPLFWDLNRALQISPPRTPSSIVRCRRRQHNAQKLGADAGEKARHADPDDVPGGAGHARRRAKARPGLGAVHGP
jgi:hypothetical protein